VTKKHALIFILIIFSCFFLLKKSGIFQYVTLQSIQNHIDNFKLRVDQHYFLSIFLFICGYALTIMIAVPGFAPLTMVGGYLFGIWYGAFFALIGSFLGSMISYLAVKLYLRTYVLDHYRTSINRFTSYVEQYGLSASLLLLHFLTVIPFFLINAFAAVSEINITTFIWTTIIGTLPLVFLYAFAGQQLQEIDSIAEIFSPTIIFAFIILILLVLIPMFVRKWWMRNKPSNKEKT